MPLFKMRVYERVLEGINVDVVANNLEEAEQLAEEVACGSDMPLAERFIAIEKRWVEVRDD